MNVSPAEKLILLMLCEIQEKLEIDGEVDHAFIKEATLKDQTWAIGSQYGFLVEGTDWKHPSIVDEVFEVLGMWHDIERSYAALSSNGKSELHKLADTYGENPVFGGFDGNNEIEHLMTAKFIIHQLERYSEFADRELNTHSRSLDVYQRMLPTYSDLRLDNYGRTMTAEELAKVLLEQIHPTRRT